MLAPPGAACVATVLVLALAMPVPPAENGEVIVFAHLSDPHLDGGDRARDRLRRTMAYVRQARIDAILVTGDITDHGRPDEYAQARAELVAGVPVLVLPGNTDLRGPYRAGLLGTDPDDLPVNRSATVGGVLFALCDSLISGHHGGLLTAETLDWLRDALDAHDGPAVVAFHHPPVSLHMHLHDPIALINGAELATLLDAYPQVAAVLTGHAHSGIATMFAGRPLLIAPGVVGTFQPPFLQEGSTWAQITEPDAPPGVAFHVLDDDGRMITHFRAVP